MKAITYSGGSTKLSAIYGAAKAIHELGYSAMVFAGVSSGAIVALFASIGKFDIDEAIFKSTEKDIFRIVPKINMRTLIRVLRGKSLGDQSNLKKLIKRNFSIADFETLRASGNIVLVGAVNFSTGLIEYLDIRNYSYKEAIDMVYASACIPFYTEGQKIGEDRYYDGGVIDHNPSSYVATHFNLTELVSIYSRPKVVTYSTYDGKQGASALKRAIEIMTMNNSIEDERLTHEIQKQKKFELTKVFMPYKLQEKTYGTGYQLFKAFYQIGWDSAYSAYSKKIKDA